MAKKQIPPVQTLRMSANKRNPKGRFAPKSHLPTRTHLLYISAVCGVFFAVYGLCTWGYNQITGHAEKLELNDSAYARATRAVQWIDKNSWRFNFIGPIKSK